MGKIIRIGTGMGWMDILIQVEDKDDAISKLKSIIKETGAKLNFTIEDMERTSLPIQRARLISIVFG